jgi:hypothetical protein
MVYIRVVLAVDNVELEQDGFNFEDRLTVFIEEDDAIVGAYVSGPYETRDEAIHHETWRQK